MHAGIDISAGSITVATLAATHELALEGRWEQRLAALLGRGAIVALEPTGGHYSAPVIAALALLGAEIIQVDHATTKRYRQLHVSSQKTDASDAQALLQIALEFTTGTPPRGVKRLSPAAESLTAALRAAIQNRIRITKARTRTINRLKQLAYHVWPALARRLDTYRRAVSAGAVTPAELKALATRVEAGDHPDGYKHGAARRALLQLAAEIPDGLAMPPMFQEVIIHEEKNLSRYEEARAEADALLTTLIEAPRIAAVTEAWRTIPGASDYAIATLHAAAHCAADGMTGDQLRGALGFYPQRYESGQEARASQPMRGYAPARGAVHIWTMSLIRHAQNPIAAYFREKKAAGHQFAFPAARGKFVRVLAGIARNRAPCSW